MIQRDTSYISWYATNGGCISKGRQALTGGKIQLWKRHGEDVSKAGMTTAVKQVHAIFNSLRKDHMLIDIKMHFESDLSQYEIEFWKHEFPDAIVE